MASGEGTGDGPGSVEHTRPSSSTKSLGKAIQENKNDSALESRPGPKKSQPPEILSNPNVTQDHTPSKDHKQDSKYGHETIAQNRQSSTGRPTGVVQDGPGIFPSSNEEVIIALGESSSSKKSLTEAIQGTAAQTNGPDPAQSKLEDVAAIVAPASPAPAQPNVDPIVALLGVATLEPNGGPVVLLPDVGRTEPNVGPIVALHGVAPAQLNVALIVAPPGVAPAQPYIAPNVAPLVPAPAGSNIAPNVAPLGVAPAQQNVAPPAPAQPNVGLLIAPAPTQPIVAPAVAPAPAQPIVALHGVAPAQLNVALIVAPPGVAPAQPYIAPNVSPLAPAPAGSNVAPNVAPLGVAPAQRNVAPPAPAQPYVAPIVAPAPAQPNAAAIVALDINRGLKRSRLRPLRNCESGSEGHLWPKLPRN